MTTETTQTIPGFYAGFLQKRQFPGLEPVYGPDEQDTIEKTVKHLLSIPTTSKNPGVLLGMIQSGKTKVFQAVIARAFDHGFDIAVVLTKPTTALAKQTFKRVKRDFGEFIESDQAKAYDILEIPDRLSLFELGQKLVFVLKKQTNNLERLSDALLVHYPHLKDKRILIIDDEADHASIGYAVGDSGDLELRKIAEMIDDLRQQLPNACFLQVTATPYSLYLQPEDSPLPGMNLAPVRPKFTELVPVHKDYVGGDYYFRQSQDATSPASFIYTAITRDELTVLRQPDARRFKIEDALISDKIPGLRTAIVVFLTGGTLRRIQDERTPNRRPKRFAFLFHTEAARASHAWQETVVLAVYDQLKAEASKRSSLLESLVKSAYDDLARSVKIAEQPLPAFEEVWSRVVQALNEDQITVTKVNSEAQVTTLLDDEGQLGLRTPLNIFIGGQILDRGITITNLIGFYYGRDPQRFQQDTVMQHSRMYGFRSPEDRAVTRFYTAPHIYAAMKRMHEADEALRERIQKAGDDRKVTFIELDDQGAIIACSPTKILASNITTLRPHRRILPYGFQTDFKIRLQPITEQINAKLETLVGGALPAAGETPKPVDITLPDAIDIIERLGPTFSHFDPGFEDTWDIPEYKAILSHLSESCPNPHNRGRVFLIVRTGRQLSRILPSGKHADSPDTGEGEGAMAKQVATDLPVLMLIRQEGASGKGWRDCPFWWPVILTPLNTRTTLFARAK